MPESALLSFEIVWQSLLKEVSRRVTDKQHVRDEGN